MSSSVAKEHIRVEACFVFYLLNVDFLLGLLSNSEDGGSIFLQNIG
jgi:hypothetical protein